MSAPLLASAVATHPTIVEITFDQAMLVNAAFLNPNNYVITPAPPGPSSAITVQAIGSTIARLILATDLKLGAIYSIHVVGLTSALGESIDDDAKSSFSGLGTPPSFSNVEALDKSTVRVTFNEPMALSLIVNPSSYAITSLSTGKMISVLSAQAIDAGTGFFSQVDLSLGSKMTNDQDHELTCNGLTDAAGNPQKTGDIATFDGIADLPRMIEATLEPANPKLLVLEFDTPLEASFAVSLSSYRIISPAIVPRVYVASVSISDDRRNVTLRISESRTATIYAVQASSSVIDDAGNALDPAYSYQFITGVGEAPTLVRWERISRNRVDVHFSEPMLDGAEIRNPSRYTFDNGLSTVSILAIEGSIVKLATTDVLPGVLYTLTIA